MTSGKGLKGILGAHGYGRVTCAENGNEALSILAADTDSIHLVLLDLVMPGLDGFGVLRHLTNVHRHHVGVIVITGYSSDDYLEKFYSLGSEHVIPAKFFSKPMETSDLLDEVEAILLRIREKRQGHLQTTATTIQSRLDHIEASLKKLEPLPASINQLQQDTALHRRGILAELGFELLKAIVIALAIVATLYLGVGDLLRKLLGDMR